MAQCSRGLLGTALRRFQSGATHIPAYKPSTGSSLGAGNQVPAFQKYFQIGRSEELVYLRGSNDRMVFRGLMTVSLGGIGVALYCLYLMATGKMPKKERTS